MTTSRKPQAASAPYGNRSLESAKKAKNDEYYTQLADIENELRHYREQLRGKVVFCNCDDPYESNFFKYFALNFNFIGIKKLIATSYKKSPIVGGQLPMFEIEGLKPEGREPYVIEITEVPDHKGRGATDLSDVDYLLRRNSNTARPLNGDKRYGGGDFRSSECVELLKQADIVVTNPPFSLFREYVAQLVEHGKKFLIIGNKNAITYKETFALIKENKLWIGVTPMGVDMLFDVPPDFAATLRSTGKEGSNYKIIGGKVKGRSPSIWLTNMDNPKRHEEIQLYKKYTPSEYPTYVNYEAIEVGKVKDIPVDYDGAMGVPITFLDKYNPEQFEVLGSSMTLGISMSEIATKGSFLAGGPRFYLSNGDGTYKRQYDRIAIKRKST